MSGEEAWEQPTAGRRWWVVLAALALVAAALWAGAARGDGAPPSLDVSAVDEPLPTPPPAPASTEAPGGVGRWQQVAHAPIVRRTGHSAVWTGDEVIVWGGVRTDPRPHVEEARFLADGAAYATRGDTWRRLPAAPIPGRYGHHAVWTGREMLVWGGSAGGPGAAYDPRANRWRTLPDGPLEGAAGARAGWTGEALVVWRPGEPLAAAYWPKQDTWETPPPAPSPGDPWSELAAPETLDPATVVAEQLAPRWAEATLVDAAGRLVLWDGAAGKVLRAGANIWEPLTPPPLEPREGAVAVWAADRLVVWGGAAAPRHFADGAVLHLPPYGHGSRVSVGR